MLSFKRWREGPGMLVTSRVHPLRQGQPTTWVRPLNKCCHEGSASRLPGLKAQLGSPARACLLELGVTKVRGPELRHQVQLTWPGPCCPWWATQQEQEREGGSEGLGLRQEPDDDLRGLLEQGLSRPLAPLVSRGLGQCHSLGSSL